MTVFRERQYEPEYRASVARKTKVPHTFQESLAQLLAAYREELPDRIHSNDVWRDRVSPGEAENGVKAVGGSLLGSPRTSDAFRTYIEERPGITERAEYDHQQDPNVSYKYPLRAALAELAGRGKDTDPYPFMARALFRTALRDGDWDGACASLGICEPVRRVYIEEALRRLWQRFSVEPPARTIRTTAA